MVAEWGDCSTAAANGDGSTSSKCYTRSVANPNIQDSTNSVPFYTSTKKHVGSDLSIIESSISESADAIKPVRCSNSPDFCHLQSTGHATCIALSLRQLALEDGYHDMVLLCDGKKIVAHKLVLSAASSFLKAVLETSSEWSPAVVSVEGVGWAVMQLLLQYIYLGEAVVPAHLLPDVVAAGEALGVTGLKDFRDLLSPQAQTNPDLDETRQDLCSSPPADECGLRTREIQHTSIDVLDISGNNSVTTGNDDLTKPSQPSSQLRQNKRRRRLSCTGFAKDGQAKKFGLMNNREKINSNGSDQSSIDSNEEIEVGSPPQLFTKLISNVTQEADPPSATTTANDDYTTGGSSLEPILEPSRSSSSSLLETCTNAASSFSSAGPSVKRPAPWHQEVGSVTMASDTDDRSNLVWRAVNLNSQEKTDLSGGHSSKNDELTASVHLRLPGIDRSHPSQSKDGPSSDHGDPSHSSSLGSLASTGSGGKQLHKASHHTARDSSIPSAHVRGDGNASSTLSAFVENIRATHTLSNLSAETAGRNLNTRNHNANDSVDNLMKAAASKRSSNFIKENILGLGSELPSANLFKMQQMSSGSNSIASPLAQLLNVGEKLTPNYSTTLNNMLMAAGRTGTTSNACSSLDVSTGEGIHRSSTTNGDQVGSVTNGHHASEKNNKNSEDKSADHDANDDIARRSDDLNGRLFGEEIKAEFNKQNMSLALDSREDFGSISSNACNSRPTKFVAAKTKTDFFQELGYLPASALFNKSGNVSAFLSSLASNGRFDHLNFKYQNGNSGNIRSEHSSNPREVAAVSWDYQRNDTASDPPPIDEDMKRLLLLHQQTNGAAAGPSDNSRPACPEPATCPPSETEEPMPQQHRFATQEEIDAALDVYQRKLAFHEPRPCPSCQRMYRDAATLRTHINIMHTAGPEPFVCSCGFLFRTKYEMYHHKKNGHYATSQPKL